MTTKPIPVTLPTDEQMLDDCARALLQVESSVRDPRNCALAVLSVASRALRAKEPVGGEVAEGLVERGRLLHDHCEEYGLRYHAETALLLVEALAIKEPVVRCPDGLDVSEYRGMAEGVSVERVARAIHAAHNDPTLYAWFHSDAAMCVKSRNLARAAINVLSSGEGLG